MATTFLNSANNAYGTLNTAIDADDTTIVLSSGEGARFASSNFPITIDSETILITSRSTDTLTVGTRAYAGTTAAAHDAGATVENLIITTYLTDIHTAVNAAETTVAAHTTSINGIIAGTQSLSKVLTSGASGSSFTVDDATTNNLSTVAAFYHTTSGTAANSIGAKIIVGAENASGTVKDAIEFRCSLATATNGAENSTFSVFGLSAGASAELLSVRGVDKMVTTHGLFFNDSPTQWILQHQPASGAAGIRFAPVPDSTSACSVDFFRTTNTSGQKTFAVKLGDNSNNNAFAVVIASGNPVTHFYSAAGASVANFDASGNLTISGDAAINGGDITTTAASPTIFPTTATLVRMFGSTASDNTFVLGDGTTAGTYARRFAINIPNNAANQAQIQFQWAGSAKWSIYNVGGTDNLRIYSHTNTADLVTFSTTGVTISADTDASLIAGRARIDARATDVVYFSHYDQTTTSNYALAQGATGNTFLNAVLGGSIEIRINNASKLSVAGSAITVADAYDFVFNTTTGSKLGTSTLQKLAFYNSTPIVQPSTTGELTGYTSSGLYAVLDGSTFTGNVGTKAYTLGDIVKHLKNLGLIASS